MDRSWRVRVVMWSIRGEATENILGFLVGGSSHCGFVFVLVLVLVLVLLVLALLVLVLVSALESPGVSCDAVSLTFQM